MTRANPNSALLAIDIQNDFLDQGEIELDGKKIRYEKGALPVPHSCEILSVIHRLATLRRKGVLLIATQDWHPPNHHSFSGSSPLWPIHCIQNSKGADFPEGMPLPDLIVHKGAEVDSLGYDAIQDRPDLINHLKREGIQTLFIFGLAYDFCVGETAKSALLAGYRVVLIEDATRGIFPDQTEKMRQTLRSLGAEILSSSEAISRYPDTFMH